MCNALAVPKPLCEPDRRLRWANAFTFWFASAYDRCPRSALNRVCQVSCVTRFAESAAQHYEGEIATTQPGFLQLSREIEI